MTWLEFRKERGQTQAEAIAFACARFAERTGRPATQIEAPGTWTPPRGCGLEWRGNSRWTGEAFRVGAPEPPAQGRLL